MAREGILAGLVLIPFKRFLKHTEMHIFDFHTAARSNNFHLTFGMFRCKVYLTLFPEQVVILRAISFKTAKTCKT